MPRYADHRQHLETIFRAALQAADPAQAVRQHWNPSDIADAERIFLVGAGKGGVAMGATVAELVGERLIVGVVAVPQSTNVQRQTGNLRFIEAGHPQPNAGSVQAGEEIAAALSQTTEHDLVIAVFSGGGSALLERLVSGVSLERLQTATSTLMRAGATVNELNCVRKHLSQIKGGGLAKMAYPARVLALILSDVIGDPLDVIASGPTVADPTTVSDAKKYLDLTGFEDLEGLLHETPKPGDPIFERVTNRLIGSNQLAREAAAEAARKLGFETILPDEVVQGEAREWWANIESTIESESTPTAFIFGGETTVTVNGNGVGGRNHELALGAALVLDGSQRRIVVGSMGTDGVDGLAPAAGAFASPETCGRARTMNLDPKSFLENNDSYSFFSALGDCFVTGPTGTNVNDLAVVLTY